MEENFSPERYLNDSALLQKTLLQLEKEFQAAGINFSAMNVNLFDFVSICNIIAEHISGLNSHALQQLLYRIDVPESRVIKAQVNSADNNLALAELIVKRVLQKVVIREYYSKDKS